MLTKLSASRGTKLGFLRPTALSGSLHLFLQDTILAVREIAFTPEPGAPLAVITFTAGSAGILRSPSSSQACAHEGSSAAVRSTTPGLVAVVLSDFVDGTDVWMVRSGSGTGFPLESLERRPLTGMR